ILGRRILWARRYAFVGGVRNRIERHVIERDRMTLLGLHALRVDDPKSGERAVAIDDRGVLVAVIEVSEIDFVREHLVTEVRALEFEPPYLGRRRIRALVVLEPSQCGVTFVDARLVVGLEAREERRVGHGEQGGKVVAEADESR